MNKALDSYQYSLTLLSKLPKNGTSKERLWVQKYLGSDKPTKCIKGSEIIKLAKNISDKEKFTSKKLVRLLNKLYKNATTFEEVDLAARLLQVNSKLKNEIDPKNLDYWLNYTHGWAENDVLCQSNFTGEIILANWTNWKKLLLKFSKDKNIHKRRASLVLLNKSFRDSTDQRLYDLALQNIEVLKSEKDILITKAISWLLRSMTKHYKSEISDYVKHNRETLPKIAVREVTNKLQTGTKAKKKVK